jgi:hypothetical protein
MHYKQRSRSSSKLSNGKSIGAESRAAPVGQLSWRTKKNSSDIEGRGEARLSAILLGEGVLQTFGDESSPRFSKAGTRAARSMRVMVAPPVRGLRDGAATSSRQNFLETPTNFTRAHSISNLL